MPGTKLRALYQRKKGRDLYDPWLAVDALDPDPAKIADCFEIYMERGGAHVSRAEFEANLLAKLDSCQFVEDIQPLLPTGATHDVAAAGAYALKVLVSKSSGDTWKGPGS